LEILTAINNLLFGRVKVIIRILFDEVFMSSGVRRIELEMIAVEGNHIRPCVMLDLILGQVGLESLQI